MELEELKQGQRIEGVVPSEVVTVMAAMPHGATAVELVYRTASGVLGQLMVFRDGQDALRLATRGARPFDADADDYRLLAEAQRIRLAGLFDPMLAVATSAVQPLPHQIRAVYEELLPRSPLRFLLADDPGAGKTIMAGLYIKELILRDDVHRCLIVAPGGLVEQWQDELRFKFGLEFRLLTNQDIDAAVGRTVFDTNPLLIARMDQLARNEDLKAQLAISEWDLVVVDEAHRMGAHYFNGKLEKTKRFQLGELLGDRTRHLLLMTATPHSGKEEDFQLFLTLLDRDRFAGKFRRGVSSKDVAGVMRRMIKEDLRTFDGKALFPERLAETIPYALSEPEYLLYEHVTEYVRDGMNRADSIGGKRQNTVGFALTVLQRRLASSPEAIYKSLLRRTARLERKRNDIVAGRGVLDGDRDIDQKGIDADDYAETELEEIEEELLDSATAALTIAELDTEIRHLEMLAAEAKVVRNSGSDKKWTELRAILQDETLLRASDGGMRKLIVFTEHRDTLEYLIVRIRELLGQPEAVQAIHGGVRRSERRRITEEFTRNPDCRILIATDAAGEGLNLQAAHLMVNYDLPWNPNRIEQRFGRIHRIGQREVCLLWNLVAQNTREGAVFVRLLEKVDEQRRSYGGKVFDVLGAAFEDTSLRSLLIDAIRHGDLPETRAEMNRVIEAQVGDGLRDLLEEKALAQESLSQTEVHDMRHKMDEARARRLQPHYIDWVFRAAFARFGGRLVRRERGRYEISAVPAPVRNAVEGGLLPTRYERVTFDIESIDVDDKPRADLLAPGHPLHDAVLGETLRNLSGILDRGTVLVSTVVHEPMLLVGVVEEIADATEKHVARRFGYAYVDALGTVTPAGPAPYLDCAAAPPGSFVDAARRLPWLDDAEARAQRWIIENQLPGYLTEVQLRRDSEVSRTRAEVELRLTQEIARLRAESRLANDKERNGERPRETSDSLLRKSDDLVNRLTRRLALLDKQQRLGTRPPRLMSAAVVLPLASVESNLRTDAPIRLAVTAEVEQRGIARARVAEQALGRSIEELTFANPGYDILSTGLDGVGIRTKIKVRHGDATAVYVSHTELVTGKNAGKNYRLALVELHPYESTLDEIRYLDDPFADVEAGDVNDGGLGLVWRRLWSRAQPPF